MESADGFDAPIAHIKEGKNVYFRYEDPYFSILKKELSAPEKEVLPAAPKNIIRWLSLKKTKNLALLRMMNFGA